MKILNATFLVLALPAALLAQQAALTETKLPDETAKPAQSAEITVIQPGPAKTAAPAAAAPKTTAPAAKKAAAAAAKPAAKPAGTGLVVRPGAPKVQPKTSAPAPAAARATGPVKGFVIRPGAPRVQPKENAAGGFAVGKKHTVTKGDTLWDLSGKYYRNPFMWGRIYNANFKTVADPDRINPKEELYIPDLQEIVLPYRRPAVVAAVPEEGDDGEGDGEGEDYSSAPARRKAAVSLSAVSMPGELLRDFDRNFISEEMPEDQREWGSGVRIVTDDWSEDGVVTAKLKDDDDFSSEGLSVTGETLEIDMEEDDAVRPGDYLAIFLKGGEAYDKAGNYKGREIQPAGLAEVLSVDGSVVKARVIDASTAISKGYIVKKK